MADFGRFSSLFDSLLCHENIESAIFDRQGGVRSSQELIDNDSYFALKTGEIECIERMIEKESRNPTNSDNRSVADPNQLKVIRLGCIDVILQARIHFGFRCETTYLSVTYLDRLLPKSSIDVQDIRYMRLLSIACISLAAKMEESEKAPYFSEFSTADGVEFDYDAITRTEFSVLDSLQWNMNSITPFFYLRYFISKVCAESPSNEAASRAGTLILAVLKDTSLLDYGPPIIAMAAVLAASDDELTKQGLELKMNVVPSWGPPETERVFSCYLLMQKMAIRKRRDVISGKRGFPHDDSDQSRPCKRTCRLSQVDTLNSL